MSALPSPEQILGSRLRALPCLSSTNVARHLCSACGPPSRSGKGGKDIACGDTGSGRRIPLHVVTGVLRMQGAELERLTKLTSTTGAGTPSITTCLSAAPATREWAPTMARKAFTNCRTPRALSSARRGPDGPVLSALLQPGAAPDVQVLPGARRPVARRCFARPARHRSSVAIGGLVGPSGGALPRWLRGAFPR